MTVLVTGSSGHLGEALVRLLRQRGQAVRGIDLKPSPYTELTGSISDRGFVREAMVGISAVLHAATLHKPHLVTHSPQQFIETNVLGTQILLEEAARAGVSAFVQTSTTSTFGDALAPAPGLPAAWITEEVRPIPKNMYGATKLAAEQLCQVAARNTGLPVVVLRVSRFFPEDDDSRDRREAYSAENLQAIELLYRRADIEDMAEAHFAAVTAAPRLGFGLYVVSSTAPFDEADLAVLNGNAAVAIARHYPEAAELFARRGWRLPERIDRVYVNGAARAALDWTPRRDFAHVLQCLKDGRDFRSELALAVGKKGYHNETFAEVPYPV